jgi:DNA-binding NarL/FixJ family response regulator
METMLETPTLGANIRILIADDHEIIRVGIGTFLQGKLKCEPCLEAADGRVAVKIAEAQQPDVVIADIGLPGLNGLELIQQIKRVSPESEIMVLTGNNSVALIKPAFEAGAKAFLLKVEAATYLAEAVQALAGHRFFITPYVHQILYGTESRGAVTKELSIGQISVREREILQLLAEGQSNKEIAGLLGISVKTVETHRAAIMRKLKFDSFSDLVRYAIRHQIIQA